MSLDLEQARELSRIIQANAHSEFPGVVRACAIHAAKVIPELLREVAGLRALVGDLREDAAAYRLISEEVAGKLLRDGWDDDAAEEVIALRWAQHMDQMHPGCTGPYCMEVADES